MTQPEKGHDLELNSATDRYRDPFTEPDKHWREKVGSLEANRVQHSLMFSNHLATLSAGSIGVMVTAIGLGLTHPPLAIGLRREGPLLVTAMSLSLLALIFALVQSAFAQRGEEALEDAYRAAFSVGMAHSARVASKDQAEGDALLLNASRQTIAIQKAKEDARFWTKLSKVASYASILFFSSTYLLLILCLQALIKM